MKVMTFNIRGSFHDDGINNWDKRRDLNIATILKYDPDIIGFQEAQQGNFDDYAEPLSAYDLELGPMYIQQTEDYYRVPIYWKKDIRATIQQIGVYGDIKGVPRFFERQDDWTTATFWYEPVPSAPLPPLKKYEERIKGTL